MHTPQKRLGWTKLALLMSLSAVAAMADAKEANPLDKLKELENLRPVARMTCTTDDQDTCALGSETAKQLKGPVGPTQLQVVRTLVNALMKGGVNADPGNVLEADMDVAVHLVEFGSESVSRATWVLCRASRKCDVAESPGRLFGKHRLGLVFVHIEPAGQDATKIVYYGAVQKKLASNVQNLLTLLQVATKIAALEVTPPPPPPPSVLGVGVMEQIATPSDVTLFGANEAGDGTLLGKELVLDNQVEPWWDVTLGVPVNKLSLVEYNDDTGSFGPKELNKQSVYGLFNLNPWPWIPVAKGAFKENAHTNWYPHPVVGLGLTGRPGDTFFIGGAAGFKWLQFFVGSGFSNVKVANPNAANGGPQTIQRYGSRLTYGINLPVAAALKKLTAK